MNNTEEFIDNKESKIEPISPVIPKRKLFFASLYLGIVPVFVGFLILFSLALKYDNSGQISRQIHQPKYQALPSDNSTSSVSLEKHDARIEALDNFFAEYSSPLEGYAELIIDEADKHNIDYRLLPAIAMQESTLCKKVIKNSHNCWGFGIYGKKVTKFDNYEHAIKVITETLSKKYVKRGLETPEEIVTKYTPSDTGKWSDTVSLIMSRLKDRI